MSSEEDTSLRDLVDQTLTASGVLPKIKAELRANVFLALENNPDINEKITLNKELSAFSKTEKGSIVLNLVREFLQYFNLEFTLAVFEPETCFGSNYSGLCRDELLKKFKVSDQNNRGPLLSNLIEFYATDGHVQASPGLNATYTKTEPSCETTPIRRNSLNNEEIQTSLTSSEGSSEGSPKTPGDRRQSSVNSQSSLSTPHNDHDNLNQSLNLLVFTPVHDVKAVPKQKKDKNDIQSSETAIGKKQRPEAEGKAETTVQEMKPFPKANTDGKIAVEKKGKSPASSLGDLPPLPGVGRSSAASLNDLPPMGMAGKQKNMKDIRVLMDGIHELSDDLNSLSSKHSDKEKNGKPDSPDSQRTITSEEVDEDISEILNSHASSEAALTADETISRLTNQSGIDYLESL